MVSYRKRFQCDKSIAKGIKWLNKNGFYTLGSCSGLNIDHPDQERDRLYIKFESSNSDIVSQISLLARGIGFDIKKKQNIFRIESQSPWRLSYFKELIERLKKNEYKLNVRTMGISNWVLDKKKKERYSVQFYDYDHNGSQLNTETMDKIMEIFPYDCVMYKTKHGTQFISFALLHGLRYTKTKAIEMSKELGSQDYWTESKDLTLRVGPKWDKKRKVVSEKPKFCIFLKYPDKHIISEKHLEFYFKYMNLPEWVYNEYQDCDKRDYRIKVYHYKTRD